MNTENPIIIIRGTVGSGKSTLATLLKAALSAQAIPVTIEDDGSDRIEYGSTRYRDALRALLERGNLVIQTAQVAQPLGAPAEQSEPQGVDAATFKGVLANGDSSDNEIDALSEALEEAEGLIPAEALPAFHARLREILEEKDYDPDEEEE
jgi:predicted kinase